MNVVCKWSTYKGANCKQFVFGDRFCAKHAELACNFTKSTEELCDTFKEIKFTPRSYLHVRNMLSMYGYDGTTVQVFLSGGSIEDADVSHEEYIRLESDDELFFYKPSGKRYKAKDLKIIVRAYCKNQSSVKYVDNHYCETCYKDLKDVPRISLIE